MILPGFPKMMPMRAGGPSLNLADAASFGGVSDYLVRSSTIAGLTNGKSLTASLWVNFTSDSSDMFYRSSTDGSLSAWRVIIRKNGTEFSINLRNSSAAGILGASTSGAGMAPNTWYNILVSVDLTDSGKRSIYINDSAETVSWSTYTNDTAELATSYTIIGAQDSSGLNPVKGKICHLFLDTTFRDLSLTAQRRLFNDGAGSPAAGQASLNPPLYLPLVNSNPWGENLGTGGDFTGYGALA